MHAATRNQLGTFTDCDKQRQRHAQSLSARVSAAVLVALLVTGCATEFVYNRLDTLISWYFEDLVLLNDDQRQELRDWLAHTLAWHRQSELQRYAAFVDDIAANVGTPGDQAKYDALRTRFEGYVDDLVDRTAPDAARMLLELSPAQTREMLASLAEKAEVRRKKNAQAVASNKWQREQRDDLTKQLKRWTGSISHAQEQIIAAGVDELEPTYMDWAASQQAWRNSLQTALAGDHSASETQQRLRALLRRPQQQWTPSYARKVGHNRNRYVTMLVAIDATLSPAQRAQLREELHKLSGQLRKLAEDKK